MGYEFRGGMNVPGESVRVNVTRPLVTLEVAAHVLTLRVARPWGWFLGPRHIQRTDVQAVRLAGRGSRASSGVELDVLGQGPLFFWTSRPLEVLSRLAELGYPVEKPV